MNDKNLSIGDMNTMPGDDMSSSQGEILNIREEIGGYKVIRQLGAGGMGQVYLVENIHMHKQYALKVLPPNLSQNSNFIDRFKVEARVMADLEHPSIVGVHNIGHDEKRGLYYLAMSYIESGDNQPSDLEVLLKEQKKLSEEEVLKITKQICSALDYAHNFRGKGIVHRDLKPSNILLDADGNAHIADFGLAKVVGQDYLKSMIDRSMRLTMGGGGANTANMSLGDMNTMVDSGNSSPSTNTAGTAGSLIGTYEYMAPEQQEGLEATVQSDIYSLGLIIYRMLTGKKAKGRFKLPSELGLSEGWDNIIHKCLEIEQEDRFGSIAEISSLLKFNTTGKSSQPLKKTVKTKLGNSGSGKKTVTVLILLLALFGIGVGGWYGYKVYEKKKAEKTASLRLAQMEKENQIQITETLKKMNNAFASKKYPEASKYANQVLSLDSNNSSAKAMIQKIIDNASYKETALIKVQCEYAVKKIDNLTYVDGISKEQQDLKDSLAQNLDVGTQFFNDKEYKHAMEYFQKILSDAGKIKEIENKYINNKNNGKRELSAKKAKEAVISFNEALKYKNTDTVQKFLAEAKSMVQFQGYLEEGDKLFAAQNWKSAEKAFNAALSVPGYSNSTEPEERMSKIRDATDLIKKRKLTSDNKLKYDELLDIGNRELKNKRWDKAIQYFNQALSLPGYSNSNNAVVGLKEAKAKKYLEEKILESNSKFSEISKNAVNVLSKYKNGETVLISDYSVIYKLKNSIGTFISSGNFNYLNEEEKIKISEFQKRIDDIIKNLPDSFTLGNNYFYGDDVEQSYQKAMTFYKQSADSGNSKAMVAIGNMYLNAEGAKKDISKAVSWYKKAADKGNIEADLILGNLYFFGENVKKNQILAFNYYSTGANLGNSKAMSQLGKMYYYGYGTGESKSTAEKWFRKAAVKGDRYAKRFLKLNF